jgi:hypothetical protein
LQPQPLEVTVHDGFGFWIADVEDPDGTAAASLETANAAADPSSRLASVPAAYWTDVGSREHLRWVLPYDEEPLLDALARLHLAGRDRLVEGSRLVGMFRAHGLLVPVWDLPSGTGAAVLEEPARQFGEELAAAMADASPLTGEERSARSGLANRSARRAPAVDRRDNYPVRWWLPGRCCIPRRQRPGFHVLRGPGCGPSPFL